MARKPAPVYEPLTPPPPASLTEMTPEQLAVDGAMSMREAAKFLRVTVTKDDVTYTGEWTESGGAWSGGPGAGRGGADEPDRLL